MNNNGSGDGFTTEPLPVGVINSKSLPSPIAYGAFGNTSELVSLPDGIVSVDQFIHRQRELANWLKIKEIIEAHQIIEDLPDGDIIIRIKRKRIDALTPQGTSPDPSEYRVDFGIDGEDGK